jgi:hypothetical protein
MRPPDAVDAEFHLLEEISKPQACLSAGRISVFVYHDEYAIREIVVAGHAETATCSSATAILIETAKRLGDAVDWMLTCGAAYFRLQPLEQTSSGIDGFVRAQDLFGRMTRLLQEVADEKGLVDIYHRDWRRLVSFRERFFSAAEERSPHLLLPETGGAEAQVVDYAPILAGAGADAKPLVFQLEGWDFDCPEFQAVADIHLRNLQRELLRDALRRRRTYRGWLKEWMEEWVRHLNLLPREQGAQAALDVPPPAKPEPEMDADSEPREEPESTAATAPEFLRMHAERFLDRGQSWHRDLEYVVRHMPYGAATDAELDRPIHPDIITEVDFHRGVKHTRRATEDDGTYTMRQRILSNEPGLISQCLLYIRDMDTIIAPYEKLRTGSRDAGETVDATISRQIVMETMVRGWPSVFMQDEADQKAFAVWSDKYRPRIWAILAKQAKAQGVALDILLEDNVVYDVRFDDDLGCRIAPLMLVDDTTHAQLHGSRTGASVAIPLWPRKVPRSLPPDVLTLAPTNSERVARLVRIAAEETSGPRANIKGAAEILRQALACHPAEAGKLILQEWSRRLGRDTAAEFERARHFSQAAELVRRFRYSEGARAIAEYFKKEPKPVADAYVIAALAAVCRDGDARAELQKKINDYQRLARPHNELVAKLRAEHERGWKISVRQLETVKSMQQELDRLTKRIHKEEDAIKFETERVKTLIEGALRDPAAPSQPRELGLAVLHARELLLETLDHGCIYRSSRTAMLRYDGIRGTIETRGLLDILFELLNIAYDVERAPNEARRQTVAAMERLSTALWLPSEIESDLRKLAEEFAKGDWDRLQSRHILAVLREASSTCLARMEDLLSSPVVTGAPLKETLVTRIHVAQMINSKFKIALDMLLKTRTAFGGAIDSPWTVLSEELVEFPGDGRLALDGDVISVESEGRRTPLMQAAGLSAADRRLVEATLADERLPTRLSRFASCVAEALLAVEIEPRLDWRTWRDAMSLLVPELIVALSSFRFGANLMPDHVPASVDSAAEVLRKMDLVVPRTYPDVDWQWSNLGSWAKLAGTYDRGELIF